MRNTLLIARREFAGYFATPLAYVFIVIFAATSAAMTFYLGNFLGRGQADLQPFFVYQPWLHLLLAPAVAMRLWAEERRAGTLELLMTLPVSSTEAVVAKFAAAWAFTGLAIAATFPMWITVNVLGDPDNAVITVGYLASFALSGAFLAIGGCISALTRNQVIAYVVSVTICFLMMLAGLDLVLDAFRAWAPIWFVDTVRGLSFLTHFQAVSRGVIGLENAVFFVSTVLVWLFATFVAVETTKGR